jgi:HEAT repeat protein
MAARAQRFEERGGWSAWEERQRAEREWQREQEEKLESDEPDERVSAITALDPELVTAKIAEAALSDPSVEVRLEAVRALGDADNYAGMQGLIGALNDADAKVVAEALEQIGDTGDESLLEYIQPLESHPDPEVRKALLEAQEWLAP